MSRGHPTNIPKIKRLYQLLDEGLTRSVIGERLGMDKRTVGRYAKERERYEKEIADAIGR